MVFAFSILVVYALPQPAMAESNGREGAGPVGSYLFSFLGLGPGLTVPGLVTLSSDGTLTSVTGSDEAGPASVFFVKNSPIHGVWSRGSKGEVNARALYLNFDPASGVVVGITKLRIEAQFDKSFNNISGSFFMSVFVCPTPFTCPNPFTATPTVPEPATGLPFTAIRIQ
jgi:hypothetical protein